MHVIVLASHKGGSGKTTLAGHLAVAAQEAGAGPVVLIDTDPQGSLTDWWNTRKIVTPLFARANAGKLAAGIERIRDLGVRTLFIDTPPAMSGAIEDIVGIADLVLIPARPSPHDLRAVGTTVELAARLEKPAVFIINGATPRARINAEAAVALSQHGTLAPVMVHHRTGFAASMIDGRTVMEIAGDPRSADEIRQLWFYVSGRLANLHADADAPPLLPASQPDTGVEPCAA
jgi:chromosome partitioning protein